MTPEEWRPIPGVSSDYEVSNLGRVRSWKKHGPVSPRILATPLDSSGRPAACLDTRARRVHQMVALAFLGARPDGQEVRHIDGDKTNNALSNLTYGTHAENIRDQVSHGTHHMARRTECPQGHNYTDENTLVDHRGARVCRECNKVKSAAWRSRRSAVAA